MVGVVNYKPYLIFWAKVSELPGDNINEDHKVSGIEES